MPTLEDDGFVLWESNAIVRYLAAKHSAGKLWPTDLRQRADADRWMDWQQTVATPAITPVFWQLIRTPADKRDHGVIEKSKADSIAALTMLDAALKGRAYVAGEQFTMGDIPVGCFAHRWLNLPIERPLFANLEAWYGRIKIRPAAVKVLVAPIT